MKDPKNKTGEENSNIKVVNGEDVDLNSLNIPDKETADKEDVEKEEKPDERYKQEFDIPEDDDEGNELTKDGENKYF